MDLVLRLSDDLFLDRLWAAALPASLCLPSNATASASGSSAPWPDFAGLSKVLSVLPRPARLPMSLASNCAPHLSRNLSSSFSPSHPLSFSNATSAAASSQALSAWPRDYARRQFISLALLTFVGIHLLYFIFAWLSYTFIFDHNMMRHPRFLKNQVRQEIRHSLKAFPGMILLTLPWFQAEVMGYSKLYDDVGEYGWWYLIASVPFFLIFTDYGVYWIHRIMHHPRLYKHIHKPHHKWIVPTPFASHAFHPLDGFLQSVPYHVFIFTFPLHRVLYLGLFVFVNCWTIFIHDSDMITGHPLEHVINGPAHHTLHHLHFTVNYGQYFTWADRFGGSYRHPDSSLDPMHEVRAADAARARKAALGKAE